MPLPLGSRESGNRRIFVRNGYIQRLGEVLAVADPDAVVLRPPAVKRQIPGDPVLTEIPGPLGLASVRRLFPDVIFLYVVAAADRSLGIGTVRPGREHEGIRLGVIQLLLVSAGSPAAEVNCDLANVSVLLQPIQLLLLPV